MKKPVYYLWKNDFPTPEDYEAAKQMYQDSGFRVVTYQDGPRAKEILEGLRAIITNHMV